MPLDLGFKKRLHEKHKKIKYTKTPHQLGTRPNISRHAPSPPGLGAVTRDQRDEVNKDWRPGAMRRQGSFGGRVTTTSSPSPFVAITFTFAFAICAARSASTFAAFIFLPIKNSPIDRILLATTTVKLSKKRMT